MEDAFVVIKSHSHIRPLDNVTTFITHLPSHHNLLGSITTMISTQPSVNQVEMSDVVAAQPPKHNMMGKSRLSLGGGKDVADKQHQQYKQPKKATLNNRKIKPIHLG